jgi:hypothetical protein
VNHITQKPPTTGHSTLIYGVPTWLTLLFRVVFGCFGLLVAVLSFRTWSSMPIPAQVFVGLLAPTMMATAVWNKPWQGTAQFIAGESGIYFPSYSLLSISFKQQVAERWLHVPWRNILGLRLAKEVGESGLAVAFDVQVTDDEREEFFAHVGRASDRPRLTQSNVAAAYSGALPSPKRTLARMQKLRHAIEA